MRPVQDEPWTPHLALGAAQQPLLLNQGGPQGNAVQSAVQTLASLGTPGPLGGPHAPGAAPMNAPSATYAPPPREAMDLMGPLGPPPKDPFEEFPGGRSRSGRGAGGRGKGAGLKIAVVAAGAAVVVGGGAVAALAMSGGDADGSATVAASPQPDAVKPSVNPYVEQQQRRKLAYERAARAAREAPSKKPALLPRGKPIPTKKAEPSGPPTVGNPVPAGEAQAIAKAMLPSFGMNPDTQFGCLVKLWDKESGWRVTASNPSGAYGIPQALPGSKMASAGDDWRTSARTQIKWGLGYIKDRYGTPCGAWSHSESVGWY